MKRWVLRYPLRLCFFQFVCQLMKNIFKGQSPLNRSERSTHNCKIPMIKPILLYYQPVSVLVPALTLHCCFTLEFYLVSK